MANRALWALAFGLLLWAPLAVYGQAKPPVGPEKQGPQPPGPFSYEGETLTVAAKWSEGDCVIQQMEGFGKSWSKNAQALWTPTKPGATLGFPLLVGTTKDALYAFTIAFTKAPDYGQVQLVVNGANVGAPFDGYAPTVTYAGLVTLGNAILKRGPAWNQIDFKVVGKNPKSTNFYVGIDLMKMTPVESTIQTIPKGPFGPVKVIPIKPNTAVPVPIPIPVPLPKKVFPK